MDERTLTVMTMVMMMLMIIMMGTPLREGAVSHICQSRMQAHVGVLCKFDKPAHGKAATAITNPEDPTRRHRPAGPPTGLGRPPLPQWHNQCVRLLVTRKVPAEEYRLTQRTPASMLLLLPCRLGRALPKARLGAQSGGRAQVLELTTQSNDLWGRPAKK